MLRSQDKPSVLKGNAAHITETGNGMGRRNQYIKVEGASYGSKR